LKKFLQNWFLEEQGIFWVKIIYSGEWGGGIQGANRNLPSGQNIVEIDFILW